ncbi:MAG: prepilin-type N-terminal cleavage/methylation domain-containing protein [Verrucomicrobiae bacterium]|nr:prepilin-type N-terminal cleavage/methylation domain-containing protein [Verrucomicrobiae bacterium]NNJ43580.1 prepilin-type N-terminal cleavage/methylation domain-containing protein [Akkermansiaceae bacterium]
MKYLYSMHRSQPRRGRQGFTLVETVIAMGIITIMITAFLAAFGPAVQGIRKSMSAKEVKRLATTLEYELSVLRAGDEATDYATSFEKAYEWIKGSGGADKEDVILLYQYRGDPASVHEDGTLEPQTDRAKQIPGEDYVVQSVVRRWDDSKVEDELALGMVVGRVFYVRINQLIFNDDGELELTDQLGQIIDPTTDTVTSTDTDYLEAVLTFQAEFYVMKSSLYAAIENFSLTDDDGDGHPDAVGKPVFTRNMAIRR